MDNRWDAVVVGARVAGATTALLLARAGLRVLCIDRARHGSDTLSTHALMRAGTLQLQRWGLLDAVLAAGTPAVRHTIFHYGRDDVPVSIRPAAGVDALYAPRRTILDAAIANAAVEAGATVRFGTTVTGLLRDPDGRVAGVATRTRNGAARAERAALVIGADGRGSLVAQAIGAPIEMSGQASSAFLYGYWTGLDVTGYEWFYQPGISAGAIPTNDGLTCVFVGTTEARAAVLVSGGGTGGAFRQLAGRTPIAARVAGAGRVGGLRYARGRPGYLRRSWGPGWALVGDAGYWKDPLSTHGITDALCDAELLARAVLSAPEPGPDQLDALAGYQSIRDELGRPMLRVTDRIASHDWDLIEVRRLLMELASAMTEKLERIGTVPAADEVVNIR
ncbi:FAD-dependent monooxygenase [Actinoplanes sp. KI2]|uniref:FAD-dependent oxidoreductase n=1 Tax=Actinoplanes sp. KI2 TaxID=2983315 RepID=UPI0021D5DA08|nr:NAD(P)/FAD-dependent oxidoreductase [Actinoplanes sp. KI2]MCU7728337.1 FAD-dependent monooxygenase [Actinoplanes sp. KI2]